MKGKAIAALRILVGGVLVWAAISKLREPAAFFAQLTDYQVPLPQAVWQWVAVSLPWFELFCGAALIADFWPETVRPVVTVLFGVFALMLLQAVVRGLSLDCGCFGGSGGWWERPGVALARAVALGGIAWRVMQCGGDLAVA